MEIKINIAIIEKYEASHGHISLDVLIVTGGTLDGPLSRPFLRLSQALQPGGRGTRWLLFG